MNDRELLELAAKAAGYKVEFRRTGCGDSICGYMDKGKDERGYHVEDKWNPLIDDSDALRLAVEFGIELTYGKHAVFASKGHVDVAESFGHSISKIKAIRRAIVRAAAEIGKQMGEQ